MELHIYSVKAKSQASDMWVKDIMTTVRECDFPNILWENSADGLGSRRESCWGYVYIDEDTPKSCHIFPLKVAAILLNGLRKGAVAA